MSGRGGRGWGALLLVGLTGMALAFLVTVLQIGRSMDNPTPALTAVAAGAIFAALFFGPVGRAISRMLDSDSRTDDETAIRLEDLEARLAELALEQQRVAELEDRLDFTERLLSQNNLPVREDRHGS